MYLQNDGYRKFPNESFLFLWAIKGAKKIGKKFNICEVIVRVLHQWPIMNASLLSFFFLFGCQLWLSPSSSVLTLCMKLFLKDLLLYLLGVLYFFHIFRFKNTFDSVWCISIFLICGYKANMLLSDHIYSSILWRVWYVWESQKFKRINFIIFCLG